MAFELVTRWPRVRVIALLVCVSALGRVGRAQDIYLGDMKANRILFFGNSITFCPGPNQYGWQGNWGAAATAPEKDYVHLVAGDIAQVAGATPSVMATYNLDWEQNYSTYNYSNSSFQSQLAFKPNIVVVAIGENVAPLSTSQSQANFATAFGNLLTQFKNNGNPTIFVRSEFWADPTKDGVMEQVTASRGWRLCRPKQSLSDPLNYARAETANPTRTTHLSTATPATRA